MSWRMAGSFDYDNAATPRQTLTISDNAIHVSPRGVQHERLKTFAKRFRNLVRQLVETCDRLVSKSKKSSVSLDIRFLDRMGRHFNTFTRVFYQHLQISDMIDVLMRYYHLIQPTQVHTIGERLITKLPALTGEPRIGEHNIAVIPQQRRVDSIRTAHHRSGYGKHGNAWGNKHLVFTLLEQLKGPGRDLYL